MDSKKKFILFVILLLGSFILAALVALDPKPLKKILLPLPGVVAYVLFILLYVVGTFLADLKDPLRIVAAVLYGAYVSTGLIFVAEMINLVVLFNLSKKLGRNYVEDRLKGRFSGIYNRLEMLNFGQLLVLRMVPMISYRVIDLSFGLTKVPLRRYFLAALIGSLPRIFWIQYPLSAVGSLSADKIAQYFNSHPILMYSYFIYTVFVLVAAVILYVKLFKKSDINAA